MKMVNIGLRLLMTTSLGVLVVACGGAAQSGSASGQTAAAGPRISPAARQEAQQLFSTRCTACHGPTGHGDGPAAVSLNPKPRNYHDTAWQAVTKDDEIEKAIVYGGAAVGKSPAMVGNPDLDAKPEVVSALREIVRNFGKEK
jgi:mono/diheme cytochrome c family protein